MRDAENDGDGCVRDTGFPRCRRPARALDCERGRRQRTIDDEGGGGLDSAAGLWLIGVGLWARRDVRHGLERERITTTSDATRPGAPVTDAVAARSMAEVIRDNTLASTGGKT